MTTGEAGSRQNDDHPPKRRARWQIWKSRYFTLVSVLIITFLFGAKSSEYFLTSENLQTALTTLFVEFAILTIGQTLVILVRGIDLSLAGTAGLSAVTIGFAYTQGVNIWVALALGLTVGALCGTMNGYLVTFFRAPPMIATLGSGLLYLGIAYGATRGQPYSGFPTAFQSLGHGQVGPVPIQLIILIIVTVLIQIALSRTRFGRYVYAIGGNPVAARFSGIRVNRVVVTLYATSGLLAALTGAIATARFFSADASIAEGAELRTITAALLGGVSITGGEGTVARAVLGMLVIAILRNAMTLRGITDTVQHTVTAVLLLVVVIVATGLARRRAEVE